MWCGVVKCGVVWCCSSNTAMLYFQTGKLVWLNSEDDPNYENINYIYEL